jgi:hypothetical protein
MPIEGGSLRSMLIVNDNGLHLGPKKKDEQEFIEKCQKGNSFWVYHFIPLETIQRVRYTDRGTRVWVSYQGLGGLTLTTTLPFELSSNAALIAEDLRSRCGLQKSVKPRPLWKKFFPNGIYMLIALVCTAIFYNEYQLHGSESFENARRAKAQIIAKVVALLGEATDGWGILIVGLSISFYFGLKLYKLISNKSNEYNYTKS